MGRKEKKYSVEMAATRAVCLREWLIRQTNFPFTLGTLVTLKKKTLENQQVGVQSMVCVNVLYFKVRHVLHAVPLSRQLST